MEVYEVRGAESAAEGVALLVQREGRVYTLGLAVDDVAEALREEGVDPGVEAAWEATCREFPHEAAARQYVEALRAAASASLAREDLAGALLAELVELRLAEEEAAREQRIARWVFASAPGAQHEVLRGAASSAARVGGLPHWHQPRPVPRDPELNQPMVCVVQLPSALDPLLPGGPDGRLFVFGPALFEGQPCRLATLWQVPEVESPHYACLVRPGEPDIFAVACLDLVQRGPDELRSPEEGSLLKATLLWRGPKGRVGHMEYHPFEGDLETIRQEQLTTVRGLRDERFALAAPDALRSAWMQESLHRALRLAGQPATVDAELFLHGRDVPLVRLHSGFAQRTTAPHNPVEDDMMRRLWPGLGGEPASVTRRVTAQGEFGEGPLVPLLQFAEDSPLDHPHLTYGDQGLITLFVPTEPTVACYGLGVLQTF